MERALVNILETTSSFSFKAAALLEGKPFTWQEGGGGNAGNRMFFVDGGQRMFGIYLSGMAARSRHGCGCVRAQRSGCVRGERVCLFNIVRPPASSRWLHCWKGSPSHSRKGAAGTQVCVFICVAFCEKRGGGVSPGLRGVCARNVCKGERLEGGEGCVSSCGMAANGTTRTR